MGGERRERRERKTDWEKGLVNKVSVMQARMRIWIQIPRTHRKS